jgi:hypothetical protein
MESAQQMKGQLEYWRNCLNDWILWLDAEISAIASGNPPNKTLSLLPQHVSLLTPWFRGLMAILPQKPPENISVTRLPYSPSNEHRLSWSQCVSKSRASGIMNSETDAL